MTPSPAAVPMPEPEFVAYATAALDAHRALSLPATPRSATRRELDALHAHLASLYTLLETHALHVPGTAEGELLRTACIGVWRASEALHAAYHSAARSPDTSTRRESEAGSALTVCQRHLAMSVRVRRHTTATDLLTPPTSRTIRR